MALGTQRTPVESRGGPPLWAHLPPDVQVDIEERAAILEYDANLSREDAEREAWRLYRQSQPAHHYEIQPLHWD